MGEGGISPPPPNHRYLPVNCICHFVFSFNSFHLFQLNSIADRTITEADTDGDFMISFEEFSKVSVLNRYKKQNIGEGVASIVPHEKWVTQIF